MGQGCHVVRPLLTSSECVTKLVGIVKQVGASSIDWIEVIISVVRRCDLNRKNTDIPHHVCSHSNNLKRSMPSSTVFLTAIIPAMRVEDSHRSTYRWLHFELRLSGLISMS